MTTIRPCQHGGASGLTVTLSTLTILQTHCSPHATTGLSSATTSSRVEDPSSTADGPFPISSTPVDSRPSVTPLSTISLVSASSTAPSSNSSTFSSSSLASFPTSTPLPSLPTPFVFSTSFLPSFASPSFFTASSSPSLLLTTSSPFSISAASPSPINRPETTHTPASSSSLLLTSASHSSIPTTANAVNNSSSPSSSLRSRTSLVTSVSSSDGPSSPTSPPGPTQRLSQVAVAGIAGGGGFLLCFAIVMALLFVIRRKRALPPEPIFANERRRSFRSIRVGRLVLLFKRRPFPILGHRHTGSADNGSRCSTIRSALGLSRSLRGSDGYPQNPLISPYMQIKPSSQVLRNNMDIPSPLHSPMSSTPMRESEHSIDVASILVHAPTAPNSQTSIPNNS